MTQTPTNPTGERSPEGAPTMSTNPEQRTDRAHSGNLPTELGGEKPVEEFDMSLQDAVDQDKLTDWPPVTENPPAHDTLTDEPEKKSSRTRNALIGVGAAVASIVAVVSLNNASNNEMAPDPDRATSSAPADPSNGETETTGETEVTGENLINPPLGEKATPEQISYVLENPVTAIEYPTYQEQVNAIGDRYTVIQNAGELDYDATTDDGETPLTAETEATIRELSATIFDETVPGYATMVDGLLSRAKTVAANRGYNEDVYSIVTTISATQTPQPGPGEYETTSEVMYTHNVTAPIPSEALEEDGSGTLTLRRALNGEIKISAADGDSR